MSSTGDDSQFENVQEQIHDAINHYMHKEELCEQINAHSQKVWEEWLLAGNTAGCGRIHKGTHMFVVQNMKTCDAIVAAHDMPISG
eukprot:4626470-Lingulodinium_polyedra.AAC.1